MTDNSQTCGTCIWHSDGFGDDVRGSGWCYSEGDYVDVDGCCDFWQASLRDEPVNVPPERQLVENVRAGDTQIED
jgi:hypothetical protein